MTVSDIERRDFREGADQRIAVGAAHTPQCVLDAVRRGEVEQRVGVGRSSRDGVHVRRCAIGQENRPGLGSERHHMACTVVFFIRPGSFVLFDDVAIVLVDRKAGRQSGLRMRSHFEAIEVDAWLVFDDHRRLTQLLEVFDRAIVNGGVVGIDAVRQFDFGTRHAQETMRVAASLRARFIGVDDIVRDGGDVSSVLGPRTQRPERIELRHEPLIILWPSLELEVRSLPSLQTSIFRLQTSDLPSLEPIRPEGDLSQPLESPRPGRFAIA